MQACRTFKTLFIQQISSWMTANFLNLYSSKTELLLIRLKSNVPKYTTLHLTPSTLLLILASSLRATYSDYLHLSSKPVTITFVNFAVSGLTSIRQLPIPLLLWHSTGVRKTSACFGGRIWKLAESGASVTTFLTAPPVAPGVQCSLKS